MNKGFFHKYGRLYHISGDLDAAEKLAHEALLVDQGRIYANVNNLNQTQAFKKYQDGSTIHCVDTFGTTQIYIYVPSAVSEEKKKDYPEDYQLCINLALISGSGDPIGNLMCTGGLDFSGPYEVLAPEEIEDASNTYEQYQEDYNNFDRCVYQYYNNDQQPIGLFESGGERCVVWNDILMNNATITGKFTKPSSPDTVQEWYEEAEREPELWASKRSLTNDESETELYVGDELAATWGSTNSWVRVTGGAIWMFEWGRGDEHGNWWYLHYTYDVYDEPPEETPSVFDEVSLSGECIFSCSADLNDPTKYGMLCANFDVYKTSQIWSDASTDFKRGISYPSENFTRVNEPSVLYASVFGERYDIYTVQYITNPEDSARGWFEEVSSSSNYFSLGEGSKDIFLFMISSETGTKLIGSIVEGESPTIIDVSDGFDLSDEAFSHIDDGVDGRFNKNAPIDIYPKNYERGHSVSSICGVRLHLTERIEPRHPIEDEFDKIDEIWCGGGEGQYPWGLPFF